MLNKIDSGLNLQQFKRLISITLQDIGLHSKNAVTLLLRTAAHESLMGHFMKQVRGPALGSFQMEPATFYDHISWLSTRKPDLFRKILQCSGIGELMIDLHELRYREDIPDDVRELIPTKVSSLLYPEMMMFNIKFAICMARVHYLRKPGQIPSDIDGQWEYYKEHYNSYKGAATKEEFIKNCERYGL